MTAQPRPYNHVGQDVSDKDVLAARVNATFLWGESSKLRLLADLIQDDSNAAGGQRLNNFVQPALDDRYDQRTDMPVDQDEFETKGAAATFTQSLTDSLDLKIVGAYREGEGRQFIDFEELNANLFQVPAEYSDDQTSGEVQLTYTSDLVKGVGGVYYFTGDGARRVRRLAGRDCNLDRSPRSRKAASTPRAWRSTSTRPGRSPTG